MLLSKRLKCIINLVQNRRIIDVGCDHGKVVLKLFCDNKIDFAICSDISLPSVQKAETLLKENNIPQEKFSIRCGDGLETLKVDDNIEEMIIAGMGGKEIINIINNAPILPESMILQPQKNAIEVKKTILERNYHIVFDKIVKDSGKFYNIIKAQKKNNKQDVSEYNLYFGMINFEEKNKDFEEYLDYLKEKYTTLLTKVDNTNRQKFENMLSLVNRAINKYRRDL